MQVPNHCLAVGHLLLGWSCHVGNLEMCCVSLGLQLSRQGVGNGKAGRGLTTGGRSDRRWVGNGQACKGFDDRWKVGQEMGRQRAGRQRFDDRWEVRQAMGR